MVTVDFHLMEKSLKFGIGCMQWFITSNGQTEMKI